MPSDVCARRCAMIVWTVLASFLLSRAEGMDTESRLMCTPQILQSKRRQCFKEVPPLKVYAPRGNTVELKCTVGNLRGHVQWIHNVSGFLGADDVPIQKTYAFSYLGDIRRGQKYLQIRNLSLAFQGKYECQVPPSPNLLRYATQVIVLVQPSAPTIHVDGSSLQNNAKVSIRPKSVKQELVCSTVGGNPPPTIEWYKIKARRRPGQSRNVLRSSNRLSKRQGVGEVHKQSTSSDMLTNTYSRRLYVSTSKLKTGDRFICAVGNEATKRHHDPQRRKLRTEVIIEKQEPPGIPKITSSRQRAYFEGDTFGAVCKAKAGTPHGSLIWRQVLADGSEGRQFVSYELASNRLTNRLRIGSLTQADHNSKLYCEASNDVTDQARRAVITVKVFFAPRKVTILQSLIPPGSREGVVYGRAGLPKTLSCRTDLFYPNATIIWLRGRERITPQRDRLIPKDGGHILESNITVTFTADDNNRYYDCRAHGVKNGRADARVRLSIMYPPGRPFLTGHKTNQPADVGATITVSCVSIGGSPQPALYWYKASTNQRVETPKWMTAGNRRDRKLTIRLAREDNGDEYYCLATSDAMRPGEERRSPTFRVHVRFPPERVTVRVVGKPWSTDGDLTVVTCQAKSSNPAAVIRWKRIRCLKKSSRCTTSSLAAFKEDAYPGLYSGTETHSQLRLQTTWEDDGTFIECEAFNPKLDKAPTLNDRITLNVTYAPKFLPFGEGVRYVKFVSRAVQEGSNLTLDMGAVANPPPKYFNWLYGGRRVFKGNRRVLPVNGKLVLRGVKRRDAGNYTLMVRNTQGAAHLQFFLNVTYPPTLIGPHRVNVTATAEHAQLECAANANPPISTGFTWRRVNDITGRTPPELSVGCNQGDWGKYRYFAKCRRPSAPALPQGLTRDRRASRLRISSTLVIYNIKPADVGFYQCVVSNGVGRAAVKTFEVIIHFKPVMMNRAHLTKAAGELGRNVNLTCRAEGEPRISFSWFRGPDNLTLVAQSKYNISSKRLRPGLYESTLQIFNLQKSDHGTYFCQGSNAVGTSTLRLRVSGTGAPDIPSNLRSVNATDRSILLKWTQGFDGGSPQTFTVRWREKGDQLYQYRDVARVPFEESIEYMIDGMKSGKKYEISVNARNKHGPSSYCRSIVTFTKLQPAALGPVDRSQGKGALEEDMPVLIIVAACVFAFIVLVINIIVVAFILRRRGHCGGGLRLGRKERVTQNGKGVLYLKPGSDAYELRSSHGDGSYRRGSLQGDDDKTYSSYDATSDEVRDLIKKYPNEMLVPHNAYVDLLYPANAFRHPALAPIGETQLMGPHCALPPGTMLAATMDQPTLMARPSPMARVSPSSLSANSHERVPTTFQPVVLLNQHANNPELPMANYPPPNPATGDVLTNGYRSGSLTTFPPVSLAQAEAQQRHSYAEELRRVQYNAAMAGMQPTGNNLSAAKPLSGPDSNSSTLNSLKTSADASMLPSPMTAFGVAPDSSRGDSPIIRQMPPPPPPISSAIVNATAVSSADTVIRYTPNGGAGNVTSSILRPGNDYMV